MGSISENLERWDRADWSHNAEGEKWSAPWDGSETQWFGSLYFRLHAFLPVPRLLEIAPGHGRWTQYLRGLAAELHLVDLSPNCIAACRKRFAGDARLSFHVNDGFSLAMVPGRFDFIFSFDSLVHAEIESVGAYLEQLPGLLTRDGVCFLHHSNLAAYLGGSAAPTPPTPTESVTAGANWRAESVDAEIVAARARRCGLAVIGQELVAWGAQRLNDQPVFSDCFSLLTRPGSRWERDQRIVHNDIYMTAEASHMKRLGDLYNRSSFPASPPRDR